MSKKTIAKKDGKKTPAKKESLDPSKLSPESGEEHPDANQDVELIKKMLSDVFGPSAGDSEEAVGMAHGMYSRAIKSGDTPEEAMNCAKYGMKASKHKTEADMEEGEVPEEEKPSEESTDTESTESDDEGKDGDKAPKESEQIAAKGDKLKEDTVKLAAENATLKEENAKLKADALKATLAAHAEKLCAESGLSATAQKNFRALVKEAASVESIDSTFKLFSESIKESLSEGGMNFSAEKTDINPDDGASEGSFDFSDC